MPDTVNVSIPPENAVELSLNASMLVDQLSSTGQVRECAREERCQQDDHSVRERRALFPWGYVAVLKTMRIFDMTAVSDAYSGRNFETPERPRESGVDTV